MSNSDISDFVKQHPHGTDVPAPLVPEPKMRNFIPAWHAQAVCFEAILELAKAEGCTPGEIEKLRQAFYAPREPVLVSIDEEEE